ncbi:5-formyltetrahydrofolate cyclo-ligase [Rubrimonas cliftonensis]|uniref:5-formyltetrahydrofolate cyclo-ligase n=1 Tax=Rubrimonas cliftonensis TaxID=89524 RepID=A0A1H4DKN5_9RHOB|nr:5-formyltetrahydrofolate cyclo-ligase [Rubrimonas cliftonensis]SEA73116.1 5-formyltetrahydrofolate cyclo-ligase [Rubrimonas cliftonensis]
MTDTKLVRRRIWSLLADVAKPDSRFHLNFAEVIPGFAGDGTAVERLRALPAYAAARHLFVTPDNCLEDLRRLALEDGKRMVVSTYGIYRGFVLLEPEMVPPGQARFASWLDGLEHFGRPVSLGEVAALGRFDLMATGASAVSTEGIRFGKGHGFFDLEWGMFTDLGLADERTPVVAVAHDVQVVEETLHPSPTDILVDWIATPTRMIDVGRRAPRPRGVKWELLSPEQIAATPPLQ